jgi:enoyl-CoA hydratase/carnithine racemase|tara:strand:+ start:198 stop:503 length:306 start_codon:yes stop_codon:yes gene_type:complete
MTSNFIQFSIKNNTGIIHLNRPEVLNALNLEMAQQFYQQLKDWQNNPQVKRVLLKGKGRALCASADIKSLYLSSNKNDLKKNFFKWNTSSTMSSMNLINHI